MLSDDEITDVATTSYDYTLVWLAMDKARKWYEAKITSGELMVVKTAHNNGSVSVFSCSLCACLVDGQGEMCAFQFCPGCGAKIVEG